jgi:hypothetical protein
MSRASFDVIIVVGGFSGTILAVPERLPGTQQ